MSDGQSGLFLDDRLDPSHPVPPPAAYPLQPPYAPVAGPPYAPTGAPPHIPPPPPAWPDPAPAPKKRPVRNVLAGIVVFTLFVLLGSVVGAQLASAPTKTKSSAPAGAPSQGTTSATTTDDPIVAAVDPAVVDITTTLHGGRAAGTGMVISADGLVLTNNHVIDGATAIKVQIGGAGQSYDAHVLGYSISDDIALVQIEGVSGLQTVKTGDSSTVAVGDDVTAIGNALGRPGPHAVTRGKITALRQSIVASDGSGSGGETLTGLLQFDAALQPGDSGGPLVNRRGEVIGINTAASLGGRRQTTANEGYAVPIDTALAIADHIEHGESSSTVHIGDRAIIGVQIAPGTSAAGGSGAGVVVDSVQSGSPADGAGMVAGDTITAIDGTRIRSLDDVQQALTPHHPGDRIEIEWTDASGGSHRATVTLDKGPPA